MKKVEQVDIDGNIFLDYDTSLSPKALLDSIARAFPKIHKDDEGMICGEYEGKRYAIRAKNITYLYASWHELDKLGNRLGKEHYGMCEANRLQANMFRKNSFRTE